MRLVDAEELDVVALHDVSDDYANGVTYALQMLDKLKEFDLKKHDRKILVDMLKKFAIFIDKNTHCSDDGEICLDEDITILVESFLVDKILSEEKVYD